MQTKAFPVFIRRLPIPERGRTVGYGEEETAPLEGKLSPCIYYLKMSDPPLININIYAYNTYKQKYFVSPGKSSGLQIVACEASYSHVL